MTLGREGFEHFMTEMAADNHLVADLAMRARELTLFHEVTRILQRDDVGSAADWLDQITHAIQRSWPYSSAIGVRSRLGTFEVATTGVEKLTPTHRAEFVVADGRSGAIEVAYAQDGSGAGENPPLRTLLEDLAEMFRIAVDRRLMMTALRQSEEQYRSVVEQQSDLVCRYLPDTTLTFANDAYCRFFGKQREELIGHRFIELIPDVDRPGALKHIDAMLRGAAPRIYEHTVLLPDGSTGRQQWTDHAIRSPDGRVQELQGIGRDTTERWRAEEALRQKEMSLREAYDRIRSLAHRLILAQEAERTQIARELHDDVSQQLAALGIGLSLVEGRMSDGDSVRVEVAKLRHVASGLAEKVRHVSHALHPGVLQHAGLNAAIASHCEAVAGQHEFLIRFEARGTFVDVPADVALCLYRAAQQGLRNVAMHARASRAWVTLVRVGAQIELTITDNGRGFDTSATHARGLGLLSIEERVHLANGTFSVTSRAGGGSRLSISVPVGWV
jgi:PAS domain S-box-containing protein